MYKIGDLDENMKENILDCANGIKWYNPKKPPIRIDGLAFFEQDKVYRRLPLSSEKEIENVNEAVNRLAWNTAGVQMHFKTNSPKLCLKAKIMNLPMSYHMTQIMEGGFDCYVKYDNDDTYQYMCSTMVGRDKTEYEVVLFENMDTKLKEFIINFPLYGSVEDVYIGVAENADILPPEELKNKGRIVTYGTSITQGGCATRPGMAYTNILSRRLSIEFINLGFSGNGKGEKEIIEIISGIKDTALYILDYEANAGGGILFETLERAIDIIREKNKDIPILLMSRPKYSIGKCFGKAKDEFEERFEFQRKLVEKRRETDNNIYFLDGKTLFDEECWSECTVDGVHPTDLGFYQMSNKIEPEIRKILNI